MTYGGTVVAQAAMYGWVGGVRGVCDAQGRVHPEFGLRGVELLVLQVVEDGRVHAHEVQVRVRGKGRLQRRGKGAWKTNRKTKWG